MRKRVILLISFILIIAVGAGYIFGVYLPRQREEAEREKIVREYYESKVPMHRGCEIIDVARAIFYIVEQEYETGQAIPVTGGQIILN